MADPPWCIVIKNGEISPSFATANGGGEGGIRTHGRVTPTHAFQACRFGHSRTSPRPGQSKRRHLNMGSHERQGEQGLFRLIQQGICWVGGLRRYFAPYPIPRSYGLTLGYIQRYKRCTASRVFSVRDIAVAAPRTGALVREWRNWQTRET